MPNAHRKRFPSQTLKDILAQILPNHPHISSIHEHRFTESMETLENAGFTGDIALFLVAALQSLGLEARS